MPATRLLTLQKENEDLQKLITEYSTEALRLKTLLRDQEKLLTQAQEKINELCYQVNSLENKLSQ